VLQIRNITKSYGQLKVLEKVTLKVKEGQIFSLAGESGCGKSTLLRIIAGLERPDSGSVYLKGNEITNLSPEKRRFGFVFQNLSLFPHLTVKQNIYFGLKSHQRTASKLNDIMAMIGMTGYEDRYPHQLSGGQQQRIALGRALAIDPELLILDEPFSSLDELIKAKLRDEVFGLLRELNITTILVSHQATDSFLIADQLAVMKEGRIIQSGSPESIYQSPVSTYVAHFFGASVVLKGTTENGRATTPFGIMDLPDLPERFKLLIRPENIIIADPDDYMFYGKIRHKAFKGPHDVLTIQSEDGRSTFSFETERTRHAVDDTIYLKVPSEYIRILASP
jgi:iron(III) transport system ATP-binding protein